MAKSNENNLTVPNEFWGMLDKGNDLKAVENFLEKYPHAIKAEHYGRTPIVIAAVYKDNIGLVELLMSKGSSIDELNCGTPIVFSLTSLKKWEMLEFLLDNYNPKVDYIDSLNPLLPTAYQQKAPFNIMKKFISKGADANQLARTGKAIFLELLVENIHYSNFENVEELLQLSNFKAEPLYNLNQLNDKGDRLIDRYNVESHFKEFPDRREVINLLRKYGSVEPKGGVTKEMYNVDISNSRLDNYNPNMRNAPKLLNKLYNEFPLSNDEIDEIIAEYKSQDFEDWRNTVYSKNTLTIPEFIDELIKLGKTADWISVTWEYKKVLATVIRGIEQCEGTKKEDLKIEFLNCLSELHNCHLGMLINILAVGQKTLNTDAVDYNSKEAEFFDSIIADAQKKLSEELGNNAPEALIKWFFANYSRSIGSSETYKPEEMSTYSQKVMGIFNQVFMKAIDNKNDELLESYHFQIGLEGKILLPLLKNLGIKFLQGNNNLNLGQWEKLFISGMEVMTKELLNEALNHKEDLEEFMSNAAIYKIEYSALNIVEKEVFEEFFNNVQDKTFAKEILKAVQREFALDNGSDNLITKLTTITEEISLFSLVMEDFTSVIDVTKVGESDMYSSDSSQIL